MVRRIALGLAAPVAALAITVTVTSIVLLISGDNPLEVYRVMWTYVDSLESVAFILNRALPYYVAGLAVAIGFKMNLFNIGVQGQYQLAALLAAAAGAAVSMPAPLHVAFILAVAIVVGSAWAGIAGVLKVRRGVNEVVATIMLNNIVSNGLIAYLLGEHLRSTNEPGDLVTKTPLIPDSGLIPSLNRPLSWVGIDLPPTVQLNGALLGAVALGVGFYVLLWRTRFGYDLRATGVNPVAARASGVDPKKMVLRTMLISGGLAGLIGMGTLLGDPQFHRYTEQFGGTAFGFTGIAVALVGRNHPAGAAAGALLFAFIERATQPLSSTLGISPEIARIMQGTFVMASVIAFEVVNRYALAAMVRSAAAKSEPRPSAPSATVPVTVTP